MPGTIVTLDDAEAFGRCIVREGLLLDLRMRLSLARGAMADLLQTDVATYITWETQPKTVLWRSSAERIGRFVHSATKMLDLLEEDNIFLDRLYPLHVAATLTGIPQEVLLQWYRDDRLPGQDLGVLGIWVYRTSLDALEFAATWPGPPRSIRRARA